MRAWQIGDAPGPAGLRLETTPDPVPGPGEVVVRTRAVSVNYRDLLVVRGGYQRQRPVGAIPCSDGAGEIVEVGGAVTSRRVGERVTSTFAPGWLDGPLSRTAARSAIGAGLHAGVLAECFVLPAEAVVPIPAHLSFDEASTLPCAALTAWHALFEEAPLAEPATVLTLGTGGVSTFALQFAVRAGAAVIAMSGHPAKRERLSHLGAIETVDRNRTPRWGDTVRELSGGAGVDQVIEVGGEGTLEQSLRAVRFGGTISLIGTLADPAPVSLVPVLMRNIRMQGVLVGSRAMFDRMNAAITRWTLRPVIDRVFGFDEAPRAYEHVAAQTHVGKVVVAIGG